MGAEGVGNSILIDENWGWDEWWDMGTTPGSADKYSDLVGMTQRGKRGVDLVRPQVEGRGYDIRSLVAGGMQMGPCYYYAWEELFSFRLGDNLQDPYMWFIEWPTSIGEFCAGAALAEGLARTMLWGTEIPADQCEPQCPDGSCGGAGVGGGSPCGPCPEGQECNAAGECVPSGQGGAGSTPFGSDPGAGEADGGCGCSTPGAPRSWYGSWLLAAGLLLGRRRARSFVRG